MIDNITIGDLKKLNEEIGDPTKVLIIDWKIAVKHWATKHGITDKEAVMLSRVARENF